MLCPFISRNLITPTVETVSLCAGIQFDFLCIGIQSVDNLKRNFRFLTVALHLFCKNRMDLAALVFVNREKFTFIHIEQILVTETDGKGGGNSRHLVPYHSCVELITQISCDLLCFKQVLINCSQEQNGIVLCMLICLCQMLLDFFERAYRLIQRLAA